LGTLFEDVSIYLLLPTNYIVIRSLYWNEMVSGCSESRGGINIMRTPHCVTLHIH